MSSKSKDKSKDKGKKSKPPRTADGDKDAEESELQAAQRELQLAQQLYEKQRLHDRLKSLEEENEQLKSASLQLENKLTEQLNKQRDIIWYLHREIKNKDELIQSLNRTNSQLQSEMEVECKKRERASEKQERAFESKLSDMEKKFVALQESHDVLDKFTQDKSRMEQELAEYKEALAKEKREHALHVNELERRNVSEKNRLKKEMLRKVKETKLSLLAMTEDQLHATTKRTIIENDQMNSELIYQSKVTEKLVAKYEALLEKNKEMKRQISLHEQAQTMFATRTHFFQKVIHKLSQKMKKLEQLHASHIAQSHSQDKQLQLDMYEREERNHSLERQLTQFETAFRASQAQVQAMNKDLDSLRAGSTHIVELEEEALTLLLSLLNQLKLPHVGAGDEPTLASSLLNEVQSPSKHNQWLRAKLSALDSSAERACSELPHPSVVELMASPHVGSAANNTPNALDCSRSPKSDVESGVQSATDSTAPVSGSVVGLHRTLSLLFSKLNAAHHLHQQLMESMLSSAMASYDVTQDPKELADMGLGNLSANGTFEPQYDLQQFSP